MNYCSICGLEKKLINHHLSYDPEIIMTLCQLCHLTMHKVARLPPDKQNILFGIVRQYGSQWENGHTKHVKTEHCRKKARERYKYRTDKTKNRIRECRKTDRYKEYKKEYQKKYRQKHLEKIKVYERRYAQKRRDKLAEENKQANLSFNFSPISLLQ